MGVGMLFGIPKLLSLINCIVGVTPFPVVSIVDVPGFVSVASDLLFAAFAAMPGVGWVFVLFASVDPASSLSFFDGSVSF